MAAVRTFQRIRSGKMCIRDSLCIDRAAMSTEISKLQKEGFIKTNRNHFELTVYNDADVYKRQGGYSAVG